MHPPADDYPDHIEAAIRALLSQGIDAGAVALQPIAYPPRDIPRRLPVSVTKAAEIMRRDHFCCRYCGRKTIPTPIMSLLGLLYPALFPFHPNWKGGVTHPAVITRSPVIDHIVPGAWGGSWTDPDNMVTACWPCNGSKADLTIEQLGWTPVLPIPESDWDGLCSLYRPLWETAGKPSVGGHKLWLAALSPLAVDAR